MSEPTIYEKLSERLVAIMAESEADQAAIQRGALAPDVATMRQELRRVTLANISVYLQLEPALREQLREWGRRGGKARAAMPDFTEHQRRAGQRSAEVNDMAALGSMGAAAFIRKYGYIRFFHFWRNWKLSQPPTGPEAKVAAILDQFGYQYEREAMVLGEDIPVAVDFYLADAGDAVIEVLGRVHFDARFDHPNKIETRRGLDLHRIRKMERAGLRVLEIDWRELSNERAVAVKIVGFLIN